MIKRPESDKPFALSGGAETWNTQAGALLLAEYFPNAPRSLTLNADPASLSCAYAAQGSGYAVKALSPGTSGAGIFGHLNGVSEDGTTRIVSWNGTGSSDRLEVFQLTGEDYTYAHSIPTTALGDSVYFTSISVSASGRFVALSYATTDESLSGVALLENVGASAWSVVYSDVGGPSAFNYATLRLSRDETVLVYAANGAPPSVARRETGTEWTLTQTLLGEVPEGCSYYGFVSNPSLSMLALAYGYQADDQTVPFHLYQRSEAGFGSLQAIVPPVGQAYLPLAVTDNGRIFCAAGAHIGGSDDARFVALVKNDGTWTESIVPNPSGGIYRSYLSDTYYLPALSPDDDTLVLTGGSISNNGALSTIYRREGEDYLEVGSIEAAGWSVATVVAVDGQTVFVHAYEETGANGGVGVTHIFDSVADWAEVDALSVEGASSLNAFGFTSFAARGTPLVVVDGRQTIIRSASSLAVDRPTIKTLSIDPVTLPIADISVGLYVIPVVSMFATGGVINLQSSTVGFNLLRAVIAESTDFSIVATDTAPRTPRMHVEPASLGLSRFGGIQQIDSFSLPYNNNGAFRRVLAISGDGNTLAYGYYPSSNVGSGGQIDVYGWTGTTWEFQATLIPSDLDTGSAILGYDRKFACGVSLTEDGNTLVSVANVMSIGVALCVFKRSEGEWSYTQSVAVDVDARSALISADGSTVLVDRDTQFYDLVRRVDGQYVRMSTGMSEIGYAGDAVSADGSRTVYASYNDAVYRVFNTRTLSVESTLQDVAYAVDNYASINADGTHAAIGVRIDMVSYIQMWRRIDGVWSRYATIDPPGIGSPIGCFLSDDACTLLVRQAVTGGESLLKYQRDGEIWALIGAVSYNGTWRTVAVSSRAGRAIAVNVDNPTSAVTYEEITPPASLYAARVITAEAQSLPLADITPALRLVRAVVATSATLPIDAESALSARTMPADPASIQFTGISISMEAGGEGIVTAVPVSIPLNASPASLLKTIPALTADGSAISIDAPKIDARTNRTIPAGAANLPISAPGVSLVPDKPLFARVFPITSVAANLIGPPKRMAAETSSLITITHFSSALGPQVRMAAAPANISVIHYAADLVYQTVRHYRLGIARKSWAIAPVDCRLALASSKRLTATPALLTVTAIECRGRRSLPASRNETPIAFSPTPLRRTYRLVASQFSLLLRSRQTTMTIRRIWRECSDRSFYTILPSHRLEVTTRKMSWWVNHER